MHTDLPKTINEALKILAYNDYFWHQGPKTPNSLIKPHPKDYETVHSLADAQYAWTEKQAKLALVILKRYASKFAQHGMDIKKLLDNPQYDEPFRVINFEKSIEKIVDEEQAKIEVRFPYHKKIISLLRRLKDYKGLPGRYADYNGESKLWTFLHTDVTVYYLTLIAVRYDFKFITPVLLDEYDEIRKQKCNHKRPVARLIGNDIIVSDATESFYEHWDEHIRPKPMLQQIDSLKEFNLSTKGIKLDKEGLDVKIALHEHRKAWISKNDYSRDQILNAFKELDCFPLIMPVSGDPYTMTDANDWQQWLSAFERLGIEYKNLAFGFDMKQPTRPGEHDNPIIEKWTEKMEEDKFQTLFELHQLTKQFKYVDKETKIIFVRNRIPKTLIRSGIKPKACLIALGGGYYASGTDNLKRYLDSLPKTLYYNDHQPSSYEWGEKVIMKL